MKVKKWKCLPTFYSILITYIAAGRRAGLENHFCSPRCRDLPIKIILLTLYKYYLNKFQRSGLESKFKARFPRPALLPAAMSAIYSQKNPIKFSFYNLFASKTAYPRHIKV